jgi:hypothetical protein
MILNGTPGRITNCITFLVLSLVGSAYLTNEHDASIVWCRVNHHE